MDWDEREILDFINIYRQKRVLWDPKGKNHFNKNVRREAWNDIARQANKPLELCKRKLTSLLATMRREKSKMRMNKDSEDTYQSAWFAFEHLKFIWDRNKPKGTEGAAPPTPNKVSNKVQESLNNTTEETRISDEFFVEEPTFDIESNNLPTSSTQSITDMYRKKAHKRYLPSNISGPPVKKIKFGHINAVTKAVNVILQEVAQRANIPQTPTADDEFDIFGKTVAVHLRQLPLHTALESQSEILNYLVQLRLGRISSLPISITESQFVSPPYTSPAPSSLTSYSNLLEETNNTVRSPTYVDIKVENETGFSEDLTRAS